MDNNGTDKVLVSVIIPVYNSKDYLETCLDSLNKQTFTDFEAIVVDDGSSDGSSEICKRYCNAHKSFVYIRQDNSGVSVARNTGLVAAKGKYIVFMDSDDRIQENYLEFLVNHMSGYDFAVCGYCKVYPDKDVNERNTHSEYSQMQVPICKFMNAMFDIKTFGYQGYLWNKIFKKEIIDKEKIVFDEAIKYNEDRLFIVQYLQFCDTIFYGNEPLYIYVQRSSSAMGMASLGYKHQMLTEIYAYEKMLHLIEKKYQIAYANALFETFYATQKLYKIADENDRKYLKQMYKKICYELLGNRNTSLKRKVKVWIKMIVA